MAGLPPGTLKRVDANQRKVVLCLLDYAPSTQAEIGKDTHLDAKATSKAIAQVAGIRLIRPVGDGFSLTEDGRKAAHTITTISNAIARLGAPRSGVPISDDIPPMEGYRKNPLTDPRRERAVQLYQGGMTSDDVARTIHASAKRVRLMLLASGVTPHRTRRTEAGD